MHVLTVARWYPSHDVMFRGVFVADLVDALGGIGIEVSVASWEAAIVRGDRPTASGIALAEEAWAASVQSSDASSMPVSWGAGVPVARLPEVDDHRHAGWRDRVRAHTALLEPFADGLHRRRPIDLVHAHGGIPDGLAAAHLADHLGLPLVVTEHATNAVRSITGDPELADAYRRLLDGRRRLVAVSRATANELADALGVAPDRVATIGNVVDVAAFTPVGADARDPDELLWVGERSDKKGIGVMYAAMALLAARHPRLRLRLIGRAPSPEIEQRWSDLALELGIDDRLLVEGPAGRAGVAAAMARAAAFVHAGPLETFGVVAAEAVSSGLPVAARPSGGVAGVLGADGSLGTLAAGHEPEDLARAVEDVLARRTTFDPIAMRRSIEERFSRDRIAEQYARLYADLEGEASVGVAVHRLAPGRPTTPGADHAGALVVGTQRTLLERRLASLPWRSHPAVTLVTLPVRVGAMQEVALTGMAEEMDPDAPFNREMERLSRPALTSLPRSVARAVRVLLHPTAGLARRRLRARRDELRQRELERLVLEAWERRSGDGASAWLVALDPVDVLAARAALDAGARLAPGGLRWLADRLDAQAGDAERGAS